jgi:DNA-binding MarR family transcriptional regulator
MEPNSDDGRGKLVRLTDFGQAVRNRAIQDIAPDMASIISQFGL